LTPSFIYREKLFGSMVWTCPRAARRTQKPDHVCDR